MTADYDEIEAMQVAALQPDKMEMHYRQQLSAMLDGELAPDQARFLLRRLEHDHALASRWERWELCGEVMRGRAEGLLPRDFAAQVMAAIEHDGSVAPVAATATRGRRSSLTRWGGAALAASVALVALLVGRQAPQSPSPREDAQVQMASSTQPALPQPAVETGEAPTGTATTDTTAADALLASAVAVAEVPRRATTRRSNRSQAQRAASRAAAARNEPAVLVANASPSQTPADASNRNPFIPQSVQARPWPRASLPNLRGDTAAVTVGLGAASPSFYPFGPGLTGEGVPADDVGPAAVQADDATASQSP